MVSRRIRRMPRELTRKNSGTGSAVLCGFCGKPKTEHMKAHVLLSAGSNLGEREQNLRQGLHLLVAAGLAHVRCSWVYETPPWGFEADTAFYNVCFSGYTALSPTAFMRLLQATEAGLGRIRRPGGYVSRTLDLDVVLWDRLIITSPEIAIPHPRAHERRFVLEPAAEIEPDWVHPLFNRSLRSLLDDCPDGSAVKKLFPLLPENKPGTSA